jgi:hypothetical protein
MKIIRIKKMYESEFLNFFRKNQIYKQFDLKNVRISKMFEIWKKFGKTWEFQVWKS